MEGRLAAIVAADIAGFSRLVGLDEEGTLAAQQSLRTDLIDPLFEKFGGRLANTAGDSLLIEFPSAVEAVRFAIAIQQGVRERNEGVPGDRQILYRVDIELADLGEVEVKNITRPIRAFQVLMAGEVPVRLAARRRRLWRPFAAAAMAVMLVFGAWLYFTRTDVEAADPARMAFPLPEKPSLAVLPFANLAGDEDEDYFVDGLSEDVITQLSKVPEIFVIAHRASSSYRETVADIHEIAERLGVRYVLTGSVRRGEDRLRVTAQLTDALSGATSGRKAMIGR